MIDKSNNYPSQEEVRSIFHETYNVFYKKWKDISNPEDWVNLIQEANELDKKYPYPLCRQILLELVQVIEGEFKTKQQ